MKGPLLTWRESTVVVFRQDPRYAHLNWVGQFRWTKSTCDSWTFVFFLVKQNGPQQSERNKNINQRLPPLKEMDRHGVFFCTWKTAVAVNFHQLYPWNQPAWWLKKVYFPRFPGRIFTCKYPTVNSGNSNSIVDQMQASGDLFDSDKLTVYRFVWELCSVL